MTTIKDYDRGTGLASRIMVSERKPSLGHGKCPKTFPVRNRRFTECRDAVLLDNPVMVAGPEMPNHQGQLLVSLDNEATWILYSEELNRVYTDCKQKALERTMMERPFVRRKVQSKLASSYTPLFDRINRLRDRHVVERAIRDVDHRAQQAKKEELRDMKNHFAYYNWVESQIPRPVYPTECNLSPSACWRWIKEGLSSEVTTVPNSARSIRRPQQERKQSRATLRSHQAAQQEKRNREYLESLPVFTTSEWIRHRTIPSARPSSLSVKSEITNRTPERENYSAFPIQAKAERRRIALADRAKAPFPKVKAIPVPEAILPKIGVSPLIRASAARNKPERELTSISEALGATAQRNEKRSRHDRYDEKCFSRLFQPHVAWTVGGGSRHNQRDEKQSPRVSRIVSRGGKTKAYKLIAIDYTTDTITYNSNVWSIDGQLRTDPSSTTVLEQDSQFIAALSARISERRKICALGQARDTPPSSNPVPTVRSSSFWIGSETIGDFTTAGPEDRLRRMREDIMRPAESGKTNFLGPAAPGKTAKPTTQGKRAKANNVGLVGVETNPGPSTRCSCGKYVSCYCSHYKFQSMSECRSYCKHSNDPGFCRNYCQHYMDEGYCKTFCRHQATDFPDAVRDICVNKIKAQFNESDHGRFTRVDSTDDLLEDVFKYLRELETHLHQVNQPEYARQHCGHVHGDFASSDECKKTCEHTHTNFASSDECRNGCGHTTNLLTPYDYPLVDAAKVIRVSPSPPVETWLATRTTRYRYVWDGCFHPFGGEETVVPTGEPTWDAGRRHPTPRETFNLRGRDFLIRDGKKTILDKTNQKTASGTSHDKMISQALAIIDKKYHDEYRMIVSHGEFRPTIRAHRWCSHLARNGYDECEAHVVAESDDWIVVYHPTTLVIWSKECVAYSRHSLPFRSITSRYWARTIPDHDHRWASEAVEKGFYSHVVAPGEVLSPEYHNKVILYSGRARTYSRMDPTCGCKPGVHRFKFKGTRLCHRCFEKRASSEEWPLEKQYLENALGVEKIMTYVTNEEGQRDYYQDRSACLDIHYSNSAFWFHCIEGPLGRSIAIRPKLTTYMKWRVTFPFDVYCNFGVPHRNFADLSFSVNRIAENQTLVRAGTESIYTIGTAVEKDHLYGYGLYCTDGMIRGFHKGRRATGTHCVYLDPSQGDRTFPDGKTFWSWYKGDHYVVEFPQSEILYGHCHHGELPVFNVNFSSKQVRIRKVSNIEEFRKIGPNVHRLGSGPGNRIVQLAEAARGHATATLNYAKRSPFQVAQFVQDGLYHAQGFKWLLVLAILPVVSTKSIIAVGSGLSRHVTGAGISLLDTYRSYEWPSADQTFNQFVGIVNNTYTVYNEGNEYNLNIDIASPLLALINFIADPWAKFWTWWFAVGDRGMPLVGTSAFNEGIYRFLKLIFGLFCGMWGMVLLGAVMYYSRNPGITYPLSDNPNGLYTESETFSSSEVIPDREIAESLLIVTCGTRGDHIPMTFYGRLAASLGIHTHVARVHTATHEELAQLKRGDFTSWLPSWLQILAATSQGYKFAFIPHVHVREGGETYYLGGTRKWVEQTQYGEDYVSAFVSWMSTTFRFHWSIGALNDNSLPRSTDGKSPLIRHSNTGEGKIGWLAGSADEVNIPKHIRDTLPRITATDHEREFCDYKTIVMHGGKGTVDTALACGVQEIIITDRSMDRIYHTMPTPDDVVDHSVLPFIGSLVWNGFEINRGRLYKVAAVLAYFRVQWRKYLFSAGSVGARAWITLSYTMQWYKAFTLIVMSLPWVIDALWTKEGKKAARTTFSYLWQYPIFVLVPWKYSTVLIYYMVMNTIPKIAGELGNLAKNNCSLIIRQTNGMPMPFGHVCFRDNKTGETFEGRHLGIEGFGERFGFVRRTALVPGRSRLWKKDHVANVTVILFTLMLSTQMFITNLFHWWTWIFAPFFGVFCITILVIFECYWVPEREGAGDIEIPVPFNTQQLREFAANAEKSKDAAGYSPWWNCQTVLLGHTFDMGFFSFQFLLAIYYISLSVIVPGWLADRLAHTFEIRICGVNVSDWILKRVNHGPQFGGSENTTTSPESSKASLNPVNAFIRNTKDAAGKTLDWIANDPKANEENAQLFEQEDLKFAGLTEKEMETLNQPGWEHTPQAKTIARKLRNGSIKRRRKTGKITLQGQTFDLNDKEKIRLYLTLNGVEFKESDLEPDALLLRQDEATLEFESLDNVLAQIATLYHMCTKGEHALSEAEAKDIAIMTIKKKLLHTNPLVKPLPLPVNHPKSSKRRWWAKFVDMLHQAFGFLRNTEFVGAFFRWLEERKHKIHKFLWDLFDFFVSLGKLLLNVSRHAWDTLWRAVSLLFDQTMDLSTAKRVKAAWALSGLTSTPRLVAKARLEKAIAMSSYAGRGDFWTDYERWSKDLEAAALNTGMAPKDASKVGGPIRRNVRFSSPMMTRDLGAKLGLVEGKDFFVDERLNERTEKYRETDPSIWGDAVFIRDADYVRRSIDRYMPSQNPTRGSEQERIAEAEVVDALFEMYPQALANMELSTPKMVRAYVKQNVSPGPGFLGYWKSRAEAFDAGWDDAIIEFAVQKLIKGEYPTMFHHAFVKAQVVNLDKVMDDGKNLRTVVAEDLCTYFMNMVIELERNKRYCPETLMGIGMVLNQNMSRIFEAIKDHCVKHGGVMMYADASEFDSKTHPRMWRMLGRAAELGLWNHPSGNGAAMSSVLKAKYDAIQDSWIFGTTEPLERRAMALAVPDNELRQRLVKEHPNKFILWEDIQASFPDEIAKMEESLRNGAFRRDLMGFEFHKLYNNKVVLTSDYLDTYVFQDPKHDSGQQRERNLLMAPMYAVLIEGSENKTVKPGEFTTLMRRDAAKFALELFDNLELANNVHHKNQGGGTGENATSWSNSWGFQMSWYLGWMRYYNFTKTAREVMQLHRIANNGDDNMNSNAIRRRDVDMGKLKESMQWAGLNLEIFMVDSMEEMEYLGKIYCPTGKYTPGLSQRTPEAVAEDRAALDAWAQARFDFENQALRARGQPETALRPAIPDWIVVQRTTDILNRRKEFRWFQSNRDGSTKVSNPLYRKVNSRHGEREYIQLRGKQYLHAAVQRSVGHGQLCAFQPQLYKLFGNEYIEDLESLAKHYEVRGLKLQWVKDAYGLPYVAINFDDARKAIPGSKQWQFAQYLRANQFPGYMKILKTHLKPESKSLDEHERFMAKLARSDKPLDDWLRVVLDITHDVVGEIPREIYKMQPSLLQLYPDETFYTKNDYVSKFVMRAHAEKLTSLPQLQSLINQSPYGGCTDAAAAWQAFQEPEFKEKLMARPIHAYANMVILITLTYGMLYPFERFIINVPYLGVMYRALMVMLIDLPKAYSVLNLIYWSTQAESSKEISAIMPRDPYIQSKRFATFLVDFIPIWVGEFLPFYHLMLFLPVIVEFFAKVMRSQQKMKASRNDSFINPWDAKVRLNGGPFQISASKIITAEEEEDEREETGEEPLRPVVVTAGTGTGKSTLFPYSLLSYGHLVWRRRVGRIWILFPRRILRDQWDSPLNDKASHYKTMVLSRAARTVPHDKQILLSTYGHALTRIDRGEALDDDVFLMDEFHELSGEMINCVERLYNTKRRMIFLSATPVTLPNIQTSLWDAGFPPRFRKSVYINDDTPINSFFWAQEQFPEHAKSAIIRVSTFREVEQVREALSYRNINSVEVSANTSDKPIPNDDTVLVTTQVIDAGINLPGRRLLVDSGKMIKNIEGQMVSNEWSDATTMKQVEGRVGRYQDDDIVVRPAGAGTGQSPKPYSSPNYFNSRLYSLQTHVPQLVTTTELPGYTRFKECPWVQTRDGTSRQLKLLIYLNMLGVEEADMKQMWNYTFRKGGKLPEHLELVETLVVNLGIKYTPFELAQKELQTIGNAVISMKRLTIEQGTILLNPVTAQEQKVGKELQFYINGPVKPMARQWRFGSNLKVKTEWIRDEVDTSNPIAVIESIMNAQEKLCLDALTAAQKSLKENTLTKSAKCALGRALKQFKVTRDKMMRAKPSSTLPEGVTVIKEDGKSLVLYRTPKCPHCSLEQVHYHTKESLAIHGDWANHCWGGKFDPPTEIETPLLDEETDSDDDSASVTDGTAMMSGARHPSDPPPEPRWNARREVTRALAERPGLKLTQKYELINRMKVGRSKRDHIALEKEKKRLRRLEPEVTGQSSS